MKKIITLIALLAFCTSFTFSQEDVRQKKLENLESNTPDSLKKNTAGTDNIKRDTVIVEVGDEIFSVKEMGDETRIKIGKKQFRVVENNDGVVVFKSSTDDNRSNRKSHDRFRGHLGGLEFSFTNYMSDFWTTSLSNEDYYMDLISSKSNNWNFLLPCINIGFTRHFGIAATLGYNISKYRFDGNNNITKDEFGNIGPSYPESPIVYSRSKLVTNYATLPVILEAQIPLANSNRTINIGAGVIGAVKLGSHNKVVYYTGDKQKEKRKDDFSLNTLRWGATARVGYEFFQVYGTCYFTEMFEKGKGPQLYPFEVGVALTFND